MADELRFISDADLLTECKRRSWNVTLPDVDWEAWRAAVTAYGDAQGWPKGSIGTSDSVGYREIVRRLKAVMATQVPS